MDKAEIEHLFTYHRPSEDQIPRYTAIREHAKQLALVILEHTPPSADQTAAIRLLRECVMTANAAIACDPVSVKIEQVADNISFKSYYLDNMLSCHNVTKMEIIAIGEVDKALGSFYEMSAKISGYKVRPDAIREATKRAVEAYADHGFRWKEPK